MEQTLVSIVAGSVIQNKLTSLRPSKLPGAWTSRGSRSRNNDRGRNAVRKTQAGTMENQICSKVFVKSKSSRQPLTDGPNDSSFRHPIMLLNVDGLVFACARKG